MAKGFRVREVKGSLLFLVVGLEYTVKLYRMQKYTHVP